MKRKAFLSFTALLLTVALCLCGCGGSETAKVQKPATQVNELSVSNAPISIGENTYLVRAGEEEQVTAEGATVKTYDLEVTTWNVGGFAAGVDSGIHTSAEGRYGPYDAIARWKALLDYDNNYANHYLSSDIYGLQEFTSLFYYDDAAGGTGEKLMTADVFGNVFNDLESYYGLFNGMYDSSSGLATGSHTDLTIKNVTGGQLSGKYTANSRAYIKGYVTVKGVDIAVYSVHMGWNNDDYDITTDSYMELIKLMNEDEYCIVFGDMNSSTIQEYMIAAGYKAANMTEWGNINTYINATNRNAYIDNIFVSPNIDMEFVECKATTNDFYRAYSDHLPLTAYLTVNVGAEGVKPATPAVGADGYTTEYR
ncbi:MAG: hypothetical protein E7562_00140 [Ruminococcaceae bacterium]|nr:hypothetical protein [Oscillospiraceae bacterium]